MHGTTFSTYWNIKSSCVLNQDSYRCSILFIHIILLYGIFKRCNLYLVYLGSIQSKIKNCQVRIYFTEETFVHDTTGRSHYTKVCNQLGLVPINYFMRHIQDTELAMRYHGLGPSAARAIALVLKVNVSNLEVPIILKNVFSLQFYRRLVLGHNYFRKTRPTR